MEAIQTQRFLLEADIKPKSAVINGSLICKPTNPPWKRNQIAAQNSPRIWSPGPARYPPLLLVQQNFFLMPYAI